MSKAKIEGVWIDNNIYTVRYATGTEKTYSADKLPKTVQAWIEAENNKPDKELVNDFVKATFPELFQPVTEWIKTEQPEQPETVKASAETTQKEIRTEVQEMRKAEIITTATTAARSPKASEAVMFWICAGLCIGLQILLYSVQIAFIGIRSFILYMWEHRQEIKARFQTISNRARTVATTAAEIIKAYSVKVVEIFTTATATAYSYMVASLPKLETVKDAIIIHSYETARAIIITVSILAFTARITAK